MFRPMTIFQHQEGKFLRRADRGRKLECRECFCYVGVAWDAFLDHLTKQFGTPQQNL